MESGKRNMNDNQLRLKKLRQALIDYAHPNDFFTNRTHVRLVDAALKTLGEVSESDAINAYLLYFTTRLNIEIEKSNNPINRNKILEGSLYQTLINFANEFNLEFPVNLNKVTKDQAFQNTVNILKGYANEERIEDNLVFKNLIRQTENLALNDQNEREKFSNLRKLFFNQGHYTPAKSFLNKYLISNNKMLTPTDWFQEMEMHYLKDNSTNENKNKVKEKFGEKFLEEILKNTTESTTARQKFFEYLKKIDIATQNICENPDATAAERTITLEKLIGKIGVDLYKKAVQEERNSPQYRLKACLDAARHLDGYKWEQQLILWVTGPSGSGKTYNSEVILGSIKDDTRIMKKDEKSQEEPGNDILFIDGGVDRAALDTMTIVRKLAKKHGFSGIEDLHENTEIGFKKTLKEAAMSCNVSIVLPYTFADPREEKMASGEIFGLSIPFTNSEMQKFDESKTTKQIVVEIHADPSVTKRMGDARAFDNTPSDPFDPNPYTSLTDKPDGESKIYESQYFERGKNASQAVCEYYKSNCNDVTYITAGNDLIFLKDIGNNVWDIVKPNSNENHDLMMSKRDYEKYCKSNSDLNLREWYKKEREKKLTAKPILDISIKNSEGKLVPLPLKPEKYTLATAKTGLFAHEQHTHEQHPDQRVETSRKNKTL